MVDALRYAFLPSTLWYMKLWLKIQGTVNTWINVLYWRLLRNSPIFRYWYKKFLTTLYYELEKFDIDGEETKKKYLNKLKEL